RFLDVDGGEWRTADLEIQDGRVRRISQPGSLPHTEDSIDLAGKHVLPGLIDCHVHVYAMTANLGELEISAPSYAAMHASRLMGDMLDRGFTTVRDTGGADHGLAAAQAEGLLRGPRLFFGGKSLSQTG